MEAVLFAWSLACSSVSLSVPDYSTLGLLSSLRSLACLDLALLVLDSCSLGSTLLAKGSSRLGSLMFVPTCARSDPPMPALDPVTLSLSLPLQSSAQLGLVPSALDPCLPGFMLFLRGPG